MLDGTLQLLLLKYWGADQTWVLWPSCIDAPVFGSYLVRTTQYLPERLQTCNLLRGWTKSWFPAGPRLEGVGEVGFLLSTSIACILSAWPECSDFAIRLSTSIDNYSWEQRHFKLCELWCLLTFLLNKGTNVQSVGACQKRFAEMPASTGYWKKFNERYPFCTPLGATSIHEVVFMECDEEIAIFSHWYPNCVFLP